MTVDQIMELIEKATEPSKMSKSEAREFMECVRDEIGFRIEALTEEMRNMTNTPKPDTSDEAVKRSLAQILYETDWPNSKDKWKQHHQSGKPDNAARRYMRLEQAAREYLQAQLTEAQEKQRKGTQPTAPEDMRRAAIRAALEAAEGRIRYLRDCYPTAEGITALDRAREELLNLSPDDILKRL